MIEAVKKEVKKILDRATELRHSLHQIPEGSFQEKQTAGLIVRELRKAGIDPKESIAQTGVVATVTGSRPGNVIALRADMDGLNILDKTAKPYASKNPGVSHSCGHDGHMVCVLEAARVLAALRDHLAGSVRVIFQPAEENGQGARSIIESGALGSPLPSAIFAVHAWPQLECGVVASMPGMITSGNDLFSITLIGKGGHGARPHESINPILSAARIAQDISNLKLSESNGSPACAVSVGMISGGEQPNTIPDEAFIKGTIRSSNEAVRGELMEKVRSFVSKVCKNDGVKADINFQTYCPPVYNHPALYNLFEKTAGDLLGIGKLAVLSAHSMGSEDFGYYTEQIPGLLIRLGMGKSCQPLHTGAFDFSDKALESGIMILAGLAVRAVQSDFKISGTQ